MTDILLVGISVPSWMQETGTDGLEEVMRCEQRNFGSRANTPKASRVSEERPVAITNSIAKKYRDPQPAKWHSCPMPNNRPSKQPESCIGPEIAMAARTNIGANRE